MPATRRKLLSNTAVVTAGTVLASRLPSAAAPITEGWGDMPDRTWLGAHYWANPLQDWQVRNGRAECVKAAAGRSIHHLIHQLADKPGGFRMSVRISRPDGSGLDAGEGSAGFRIGILGTVGHRPELRDYRNNLAFSSGLDAGLTASGGLFIGPVTGARAGMIPLTGVTEVLLELEAVPVADGCTLTLKASNGLNGSLLGEVKRESVTGAQLIGNLALAANYGTAQPGGKAKGKKGKAAAGLKPGLFAFTEWKVSGDKLESKPDQAFGPILFNHYTLHAKTLKMNVQMPPLGASDTQVVKLEVKVGDSWKPATEAEIEPLSCTALLVGKDWDDTKDQAYRIAYALKAKDGSEKVHYFEGIVRRDPVDKQTLSVADVSCNIHQAFPNQAYVASVKKLDPDVMAFVGDQFYESTGGFGIQMEPLREAALDYLRKWWFHGWTWRELTKDRPSVCLPDDHDVFQGNLWGVGGEPQVKSQEAGGYKLAPEWVNVVHRTQTCHHPDAHEKGAGKQGITHYYGEMTYGRVSFAILADRQYKSAPEGNVPPTDERPDHVIDPTFDPKKADIPGLELLGKPQVKFLETWAADWKGADMKAVISQTIFTGMATTHGAPTGTLRIDYDQNGWPQGARNEALRAMRKAFAFHLAGDQHLPAVVHYGVDAHRDAGVAFAGPAVNVGYRRWWRPVKAIHGKDASEGLLGEFTDHFGHPMNVLAVVNGPDEARTETVDNLRDKTSGFGLVTFDKKARTIRMDCWPFGTDFSKPGAEQYPTWPVTVSQMDNYARRPSALLPTLNIKGSTQPVVQVIDEAAGEIIYTVRLSSPSWQPIAFREGKHTVVVRNPEAGLETRIANVQAKPENTELLEVQVPA